jgi:hypothetical protein
LQYEGAHQEADDMRVLTGGIECVFAVRAVVIADRRARLHRVGDQPVVGDLDLRDILGLGEGFVAGCPVAQFPIVAEVVFGIAPDLGRALRHGLSGRDASGQRLVIDDDLFGGVARLVTRFSDHHGDLIADMADGVGYENGMRGFDHRIAVAVRDLPAAGQPAEAGRDDIRAGEDRDHAGSRCRGLGVYASDFGMGVGRTEYPGMGLTRTVDVIRVIAQPSQEAVVLDTAYRDADSGVRHGSTSLRRLQRRL